MHLVWKQSIIEFWEDTLFAGERMIVMSKVVHPLDVVEINTYEQLREFDSHSNQLKTEVLYIITTALHVDFEDITNISVLKKGMTNKSFFYCKSKKYIMRIPGEGTDLSINTIL